MRAVNTARYAGARQRSGPSRHTSLSGIRACGLVLIDEIDRWGNCISATRETCMPTTVNIGLLCLPAGLVPDPTPDGELLTRYVDHGDEAAFRSLVRRHAGMVFGTC